MEISALYGKGLEKDMRNYGQNSAVTKFIICLDLSFSTTPHRNLSCDTQEDTQEDSVNLGRQKNLCCRLQSYLKQDAIFRRWSVKEQIAFQYTIELLFHKEKLTMFS